MSDPLTSPNIRAMLRRWLNANGWSIEELNRAMHRAGFSMIPGVSKLREFVASNRVTLHNFYLAPLHRFLTDYPAVEAFEPFMDRLATLVAHEARSRDEQLRIAREATERRRAEHVRRHLERERAPKVRPEMTFLDKATVAALRGF